LNRVARNAVKGLHVALHIGSDTHYAKDSREKLASALNSLISVLQADHPCDFIQFDASDFPEYFDGRESIPFGQPILASRTLKAYEEIQRYEGPFLNLA